MTKQTVKRTLRLLAGLVVLASSAQASHIIGGNMTLSPKAGQPEVYTLCVVLYYDANSNDPSADQRELTASIFRKRDNQRLSDILLPRTGQQPVTFTNPGCALSRNLQIRAVTFCTELRLPVGQYNDSGGYYASWERCCLSSAVTNLSNAGTSSLVLYTEFPPLTVANHSPVFVPANGEILCRNQPHQLEAGATDADGDQLRYRLETPFNSTRPPFNIDPLAAPTAGPYPKSEWANGYGLAAVIPGSPALRLDAQTGTLTLTPNQTGLFVFRVVAEEYRAGQKIGEVHRDFQLLVIDCPDDNPPPVSLTEVRYPPGTSVNDQNGHVDITICQGDEIFLKAEEDPRWAYQWRRNGINLDNGQAASITLTQEGTYSVTKSFANRCGNVSISGEEFRVQFRAPDPLTLTPGPTANLCRDVPITLSAQVPGAAWTFGWEKDGQPLINAQDSVLVGVTQAGTYVVKATNRTTGCTTSDTVQLRVQERPAATVTAAATDFCEGSTLRLQANQAPDFTYRWYLNSTPLASAAAPQLDAEKGGVYSVEVTDAATGCSRRSEPFSIQEKSLPVVQFDSIPALCGQSDARLTLSALPAGGTFAGNGITGSTFSAHQAGVGTHPISYRYTGSNGCTRTLVREARVLPLPRAFLPGRKVILAGDDVLIKSSISEGSTYAWSPPDGLNDATLAEPTAAPTETTTYQLRVTSAEGCYSESEITIEVLTPVRIPNGFTPNGDGSNDVWILENIWEYPDCRVEVFNRWGNRVFRSEGYAQEWDGRLDGQELPAATYYYVIHLHEQLPPRNGSVTIFR
ncbi:hypothetical protein GCM10027275_09270 [Rhabdobacter roseus]|uniref:Gliding motility-associated-like protein n=1 Tax=Rhabdobacter roseus TaxID=1655419 RepID=A0A840TS99_9BACT|nr:gliding motility-associated C-terminal domain-containing protein [Rhabdobacter roseus]MBB5282828.1 gliding motility-associated-like protein [Rhabdobacter roseus]